MALSKKSGGVRPIARPIGSSLRRLASKCANQFGSNRLKSYFHPHQVGVGIPGGCNSAIHLARWFLQGVPADYVMFKFDFANAFNILRRHYMLLSVFNRLPEMYAYCHSTCGQPSILFHGSYIISSEEGPQEGDPIGPILFSNAVQPLLELLQFDLRLGFLDDFTLGEPSQLTW